VGRAEEDDPMVAEAAEVLHEWRRAERLLSVLADDAPERTEVEVHVEQLRILYQRVTETTIPSSELRLAATRRQISRSKDYLDGVSSRYDGDGR
jgi:hypothetical protein